MTFGRWRLGKETTHHGVQWWTETEQHFEVDDSFEESVHRVRSSIAMSVGKPSPQHPDGQPHILHYSLVGKARSHPGIAYSFRSGPDTWQRYEIARAFVYARCGEALDVFEHGGHCTQDYEPLKVLDSVRKDGQTRLFWSRLRTQRRYSAHCRETEFPDTCFLRPSSPKSVTGTINMSWVEKGQLKTVVVHNHLPVTTGDAVVDEQGRIHLTVYKSPISGPPTTLHDFQLEPGPALPASVCPAGGSRYWAWGCSPVGVCDTGTFES